MAENRRNITVFSAGESGNGGSNISSGLNAEQRIQRWVQLIEDGASFDQIQKAELDVAEVLRQQPFELKKQLPFFQKLAKKLNARPAFQQFRLPGKDRVVQDRRDQFKGEPKQKDQASKESAKEAARDIAKQKAASLRLKGGKLIRDKGRSYKNNLGDRSALSSGSLDRGVAAERVDKLFSAFEKMVVERFEEGRQLEQQTKDGKAKFLAKSEGQWRQFFKSFLSRTIKKKVLLSQIRNFLFRGMVAKGGKGVFIGDMTLNGGRVEKFVRFSIMAEALAQLKGMNPGEVLGKGVLKNMSGEELMYLALAVARGREMQFAKGAEQGRFMGGKAEAQAAEALGLPMDGHLRHKAQSLRGRRGGGGFGGDLLGKHVYGDDIPYTFVPWWHWGNLARPGKRKTTTLLFYVALALVALMGIGAMTLRFFGGN
jgi:hypothetical protein